MAKFPESLLPPDSVFQARAERRRQMIRVVAIGIGIRTLIVGGELVGATLFNSSALYMDALSSFLDVACSLLLILFIKLAERPPDTNHPFGHGRYEPLAGLQMGILLMVVGAWMLVHQVLQIPEAHAEALDKRAWLISLGALILLEVCYMISMRVAKRYESPALAADAAHYRVDSLTSLFATVALLVAAYVPEWSQVMDHIGASAIAVFMLVMGAFTAKGNVNQLLDRIPEKHYFDLVRRAAKNVAGVFETEKIRIQMFGPDAHVDIDVEVDPLLSVDKAHRISQEVRVAIQKEWPAVRDVSVHIEPYYPGDH
ncbi:MAG: cation transporter [Parachlamydiaceae bacterium]|nr:cation transporter [Parachlamydiaceae bacterium]